jgi:hypothetical protein
MKLRKTLTTLALAMTALALLFMSPAKAGRRVLNASSLSLPSTAPTDRQAEPTASSPDPSASLGSMAQAT